MLTATVVGNVWSTRRLAEIPNGAFLEVEAEGTGQRLVAFDVLGSGLGERVLVAQGSVAAAWFPGKPPPVDALIIGSIDEPAGSKAAGPAAGGAARSRAAGSRPAGPAAGGAAGSKGAGGEATGAAAGGAASGPPPTPTAARSPGKRKAKPGA